MGEAIPKGVKDLWDKWNIRGLVILSLTLQTILVLLSPNRKRTHRRPFRFLIWSAYLLANWAAEYAVGQISESQGDEPQPKNNDLLAFWATFLLLHLGGPDTITALALEDNDLWLRSLFGLVCQAIVTFYVFLLSIPNNLLVPTSLMLMAGVIKYVERIKALQGANLETFKDSVLEEPDPGPDYARFVEEYSTRKFLREPTRIVRIEEVETGQRPKVLPDGKLTHLEVVHYAYKYFNIFKGLVVDLIFSSQSEQWNNSKAFFLHSTPVEALRILEVELSFIYGTFYTKVDILHTRTGFAFRFLAFASLVSSLCIFTTAKKHGYDRFDVGLTYALLAGGVALDFVAIFIFCVSDWTFARFTKPKEDVDDPDTRLDAVLNWLLSFRKLKWTVYNCSHNENIRQEHSVLDRKFIFRRWSEYIYGYNLIGSSLGKKPERIHKSKGYIHGFFDDIIRRLYTVGTIQKISSCFRTMKQRIGQARRKLNTLIILPPFKNHRMMNCALYPLRLFHNFWLQIQIVNYVLEFFGISDQLNKMIYASRDRLTLEMWEFVFGEVKLRCEIADRTESANRIYWARGEWALRRIMIEKAKNSAKNINLLHSVTQVDYDQSILMWHIATELLYQKEEVTRKNQSHREFSKILSDYLMYLLVVQPDLMSTVAGIDKVRFMEAIEDAKKFTDGKKLWQRRDLDKSRNAKLACNEILSHFSESKEAQGKKYHRRSVLTEASILAKTLHQLNVEGEEEVMWEVVSKVLVEMLCYGATHCDPKQHVALLSGGGEFLSFVWLLMAHFGLGDQFQINQGDVRAKLIIGK
ncbi:unnamed protein product [Thlaspi arvense]|uniref:DUF4220 domain-containing protein n=1 Tax=Thlaspi arvense TaxID=13288 RepID=A0AAU9RSW5_THLAR|nr:unnamed protein product [Thlaspi arvense]